MVLQIQKVPAKSGSDETLAWHVINCCIPTQPNKCADV